MKAIVLPLLLAVLLFPCVASAGVKIGNIQFDERGKIIFANTSSGKIIFPDKTEQGSATLKGDRGDKGDLGDKGDRGDKGDKGDPGQVDKATICKVYADDGVTLPAFCAKKVIFLSSTQYGGNLGGLAGADAKCQGLAEASGLSGSFKAWLTDSTTSANARLIHHTGSYVRTDGAVIAINWFDLTDGWIKEPIICDELKNCEDHYIDNGIAFTGSNKRGFGDGFCQDWTLDSSMLTAVVGSAGRIDSGWTDSGYKWDSFGGSPRVTCTSARLYCIEQ